MTDVWELFQGLVRLEIGTWNAVEARLRSDMDLPLSSLEFMDVIGTTRDCRVADIAASLDITIGGTSKIVDRMVAAGLCERRANPDDRRSSLLVLTDLGVRTRAEAGAIARRELERRFGTVPATDLDRFARVITALRGDTNAHHRKGPTP